MEDYKDKIVRDYIRSHPEEFPLDEQLINEIAIYVYEEQGDSRKRMARGVIEYLRHKEKQYHEGKADIGGVASLYQMVQDGTMKMDMMLQILPAIQNPYSEYTLEMVDLKLKK